MKKNSLKAIQRPMFLVVLLLLSTHSFSQFITTWQADDSQITIPTYGSGYNYTVSWVDVNDVSVTGTAGPYTTDATIVFPSVGTYQISISGDFPRIYFNDGGDKDKLLSVDQWGDILWTSMGRAFFGCSNLHILATDAPDLSSVTDASFMLNGAVVMNEDIGHWDMRNITNMRLMFYNAPVFNQDISGWDVSNVTDMDNLFFGAVAFNQPIGTWDVSGVTDMSYLFYNAATFNQDIGSWDVSNVTNMSVMFRGAIAFNQDISGWDVSSVTNMSTMFKYAIAFNQPIGSWQTASVTNMKSILEEATVFDQALGSWDVSAVTDLSAALDNTAISRSNYDATLLGWASLPSLQSGVTLGVDDLTYCEEASRTVLVDSYGWIMDGDEPATDCEAEEPDPSGSNDFITTWQADDSQITIPTYGSGYNYTVSWVDVNDVNVTGTAGPYTTDATIVFPSVGTYQISISGDFPRIYFNDGGDKDKLLSVDQWGDIHWTSMGRAFFGCSNLHILATDAPDLSSVTDASFMLNGAVVMNEDIGHWDMRNITNMRLMFYNTPVFNQDISGWDVSNVTDMDNLFFGAVAFNQPIGTWDVSSVTDMSYLFYNAATFNQHIGSWDVSNVTNMSVMFRGAIAFNQDISGWDVSSVTNMSTMFKYATAFNQPIGSWQTASVTNMKSILEGATVFDQALGSWDVSAVTDLSAALGNTAMSRSNYDATLLGWVSLPSLQSGVTLGASGLTYCDETSRNYLIDTHGWSIEDDALSTDCGIAAPTGLQASTAGQSIVLDWIDHATNETGYQIERSMTSGSGFSVIHTTIVDVETYTDTEVTEGATYYYRVQGINENVSSDYSQEVSAIIPLTSPPNLDPDPISPDQTLTHEPAYNGNISAIRWQGTNDEEPQLYTYTYDGLNRLASAMYAAGATGSSNKGHFSVPSIDYDLNGNIEHLTRQGMNASGVPDVIDELTYDYGLSTANRSNQLLGVSDTRGSIGFADGHEGEDYAYDRNGNMTQDLNKGITEITYNYLNLPESVTMVEGDDTKRMEYVYDAAGIKLRQVVYENGVAVKTTHYSGEYIYEDQHDGSGKQLQFIQHEEGRIVPKYSASQPDSVEAYDYQYHLKDHLGNVRVTFSTTPEHYTMTETFETGEENGWQDLHRHTNTNANTTEGGDEVELLQSGMTGAMIFLGMNKGDTIDLSVQANYEADPTNTNWVPIAESALFSSWNAAYGGLEATEATEATESVFGQALTGATMAGKDDGSTTAPMAFLNFIFFDKDMQYEAAGFKQITTAARGIGVHEPVQLDEPFIADREGYILAYLSNENQEAVNVHFDDFTVYHGKTNIVSASDYYPFGLTFNSYQRTASSPQKYKFGGKEEQDWGVLDFGARSYDAAIGRFIQVDPMAHKFANFTPYNYAVDNPIMFIDPNGMESYTYNWDKERYEDESGNEVSWDTVNESIQEKTESTNVLITGKSRKKKDGSTDWALEGVFQQAENFSSFKVIQADNAKDAYGQLQSLVDEGATLGNVIFDSHGDYNVAGFKIGNGGWINSRNGNLGNQWVRKIGELFSPDTEVLLLACHAGAAHNGGKEFIGQLSAAWGGATIYASQSWTGAKPGIFTGLVSPSYSPSPGRFDGREKAYQNVGLWSKASGGSVSQVSGSMYITIHGAFESGRQVQRRKSVIEGTGSYNNSYR